ncbi:MAG: T9SS type A sorting domain-containing protein [Ignavibacteriaceae bacterium]|nr:T9SS type A sorting domain-containing protein [Ignavibacteriaceae bacterium]
MNLHKIFLILITLFIYSGELFPQLDSVYYQGPSQGSVNSGAIQTTDNFGPTDSFQLPPRQRKPRIFNNEPMIIDLEDSQLPEYVYVEDKNMPNSARIANGHTLLINTFPGIEKTNANPPDPIMAAGPNHIIAFVNGFPSRFRIFDKNGNILKSINSSSWWSPVSPDEYGDPQILYDHYEGRWILQVLQINESNFTAANLIAYSDDEDPLGTWYLYRLDTKLHGTVSSNTWGDYPKMGYDEEAIYINTRCFQFSGGGLLYNKLRIINKAELYASNGGSLTWNDIWDIRAPSSLGHKPDVIRPSISYTPGNGGYFLWANNGSGNYYILYKIFDPITSPRLRAINVPSQNYGGAPDANQLGGGTLISAIGSWMYGAPIARDGLLYAAHSIRNSSFSSNSSAKYFIVDLNTNQITEHAELGAQGYYYLYSTLTIDQDHNIAVTFSRSADTEYIGAFYATKHVSDPPGLTRSLPFKEGLGNYVAGNPNRWGDYMGIYLDPNNYDIWMLTEYAAAVNTWGTYVGQIRMVLYPGVRAFLQPSAINFGDNELGTTSSAASAVLANYGADDLVISNIPSSFEDFNLETNLSFPITLSSYDSLTIEFSYSPTILGNTNVVYPFETNDPDFQGITLSGNCYRIIPAIEKTIYASSGSQNNGDIVTLNSLTGLGTVIGQSLFSEVKGIAIHPTSGIIYGVESTSGFTEIIRVNSELGDAYKLFNVNIPAAADIAFDTSGTFYGISVNGELYTIDLLNGDVTFIIDAVGNYSGITFHPQTNELWATSRAFTLPNKDAVFKVNLSTGDTTIIGHTGLGKLTNDLIFDENLNLFGVIGSSSELNDFVSINPANGVGTIIGSVGMQNILGLAYTESSPTSVENENDNSIPTEYTLYQNYPNPFNPTTRIDFALPTESNVKLVIYNILGQEVIQLVNNQMSAGNHSILWNANDVAGNQLTSGIYLYKLTVSGINGNEFQDIKKMILLK